MIKPGSFLLEFPFMDSAFIVSNPGILSSHWLASGRASISDAILKKSLSPTEGKEGNLLSVPPSLQG